MKKIFFIFILQILTLSVFSQVVDGNYVSDEQKLKDENVRKVLNWGIEDQVLGLVNKWTVEKEKRYVVDVEKIYDTTVSISIKNAIIQYFTEIEHGNYVDAVVEVLKKYSDYSPDYIISCLNYVSKFYANAQKETIKPIFEDMILYAQMPLFSSTLQLIQNVKATEYGDYLYKVYNDYAIDEQRKPSIIKTLAVLNHEQSYEDIASLSNNLDIQKDLRFAAIEGLSNYENKDVLPILQPLLDSDDIYVRQNTFSSLLKSKIQDKNNIIILGLKDKHWRIRKNTITYINQNQLKQYIDILEFKSSTDPENVIREDSIRTIASFKTPQGDEILSKVFLDEKKSDNFRLLCFNGLSDEKCGALANEIFEMLKKYLTVSNKTKFVETVSSKIAKKLNPNFQSIYELLFAQKNMLKFYGLEGIYNNKLNCCADEINKLATSSNKGILFELARKFSANTESTTK